MHSAARAEDSRWVRGGRLPASERIRVYQRAYFARLVECLADDYPAVERALGASDFHALCLGFIETHPPASASLNFYGAPFAAFCATWPAPFAACISELARLEWAVVEAIHANAASVLVPAALAALTEPDWARARLVPSPALRVLRTAYPVHRHYRAFLTGDNPRLPELEPSMVAVCRRGDDVWRVDVEGPFENLLCLLVSGLPLAGALDAMSGSDLWDPASSAPSLQCVLRDWVACGFFAAVSTD